MSHSEQMPERLTVAEQWRGNDMIRYIKNPDGTKTVLEHYTDAARPSFIKLDWLPVPDKTIRTKQNG